MKKKLLAVAVVGALASPAAFAQTLYGLLDVGYQNAKYSNGDVNKNFIQNGMASGSRLGVRGSEDLAAGLSALYVIELEVTADVGIVGTPGRQTYVGLESKSWGALTLGRQYTHTFHTFAVGSPGPFNYGTFASMYGNTGIATRANNAVKYSSPVMGGFAVGALWAPGEDTDPGEASNGNYMDFALRYTPGPFGVSLSHAIGTTEAAGVDSDNTMTQITANWDAGAWALYGGYIMAEADATGVERNTWHINPVFRFGGRHTIQGLFGMVSVETPGAADVEGEVWGITYIHTMSKRTSIYAGYGAADNDTAAVGVRPTNLAGTPTITDPRGFQLGLVHSF